MEPEDYFLISLAFFIAFLMTMFFGHVIANPSYAGYVIHEERGYMGSILLDVWVAAGSIALLTFSLTVGFLIAGVIKRVLKRRAGR
ncbi:MAG: hypothetical protein QE164_02590 [Candidatus Nezhaarchaeota archaeon]|nr:hypothetical protein [Candidatus Nezhaarchaeota archaeon]